MFFFGKKKELEERISQLEHDLQAEREKNTELETRIESILSEKEMSESALQEAETAFAEQKTQFEDAIAELKRQHEDEIDQEKTRSNDALIALREHIYAEKQDLMNRSEKELSVETLTALSGFGTRMERLERRYADLLQDVSSQLKSAIGTESESLLNGFREAQAGIIDTFTSQSEAMRSEYDKVNTESVQALTEGSQAAVTSFQEKTAEMLSQLTQQNEVMRSEYGRVNEESVQALTEGSQAVIAGFQEKTAQMLSQLSQQGEESVKALSGNTQAVVNGFQEKTSQMLSQLTQQCSGLRGDYERINRESAQALTSGSQAVVSGFQEKTSEMLSCLTQQNEEISAEAKTVTETFEKNTSLIAQLMESLKAEIAQAAKDAVQAVNDASAAAGNLDLRGKLESIECELSNIMSFIAEKARPGFMPEAQPQSSEDSAMRGDNRTGDAIHPVDEAVGAEEPKAVESSD